MEKSVDLSKSVHELCQSYPEIQEILKELGFSDIVKPGMLQTAGRFMTIPKGATLKKIDLNTIKTKLMEHGFQIVEEDR